MKMLVLVIGLSLGIASTKSQNAAKEDEAEVNAIIPSFGKCDSNKLYLQAVSQENEVLKHLTRTLLDARKRRDSKMENELSLAATQFRDSFRKYEEALIQAVNAVNYADYIDDASHDRTQHPSPKGEKASPSKP